MLLLGQRPLRCAGVGRSYSIAERTLVCIKHTARPRQTKIQNREMVLKHGGAPRKKAKREAQRDKPKVTLETEIRSWIIALLAERSML